MKKRLSLFLLAMMLFISACSMVDSDKEKQENDNDTDAFVETLLKELTLAEKVGQMLQAEEKYITPQEVRDYNIGSILSGGGSHPHAYDDDVDTWYQMVKSYQEAALNSSSQIPLLYGTDAVHGHNNVYGATIFPHNINLGMANDQALMKAIGEATAREMKSTGIHWNFAPALSVVDDIRWGRSYEGFSENPEIHEHLTAAYIEGLQKHNVVATAKHFIADGGTDGGVDQGNVLLDETTIRKRHLPPFITAIDAGVDSVMISFSAIQGEKMHGSYAWITEVLKEELGFEGIVLSDWNAIHQLDGQFYQQLVTSINAGIDMLMLPQDWKDAHGLIINAVNNNDIAESRIDDAVYRILSIKYKNQLFESPFHRLAPEDNFATATHKTLALEAAAQSFVLLENHGVLPLSGTENIYLTGPAHDHVGYLSGGWTMHWQGTQDARLGTGSSILEAFSAHLKNESGQLVDRYQDADIVMVVFTEVPYTEWQGDTNNPSLFNGLAHPDNEAAYQEALEAKAEGKTVIGIIASGRPLLLEDTEETFDALVAIFLPGSEGGPALSSVLYGDRDFKGALSFAWPKTQSYFQDKTDSTTILYPYGYGLSYDED